MTRDGEALEAAKRFENSLYNSDVASLTRSDMGFAYMSGIKWADEHPKSPWISVEEDLPCNNPKNIHFGFTNKVFAIDYNKNIFIAYMTKYYNKWVWCRDDNFNLSYIITHWMPIPEPPKE